MPQATPAESGRGPRRHGAGCAGTGRSPPEPAQPPSPRPLSSAAGAPRTDAAGAAARARREPGAGVRGRFQPRPWLNILKPPLTQVRLQTPPRLATLRRLPGVRPAPSRTPGHPGKDRSVNGPDAHKHERAARRGRLSAPGAAAPRIGAGLRPGRGPRPSPAAGRGPRSAATPAGPAADAADTAQVPAGNAGSAPGRRAR